MSRGRRGNSRRGNSRRGRGTVDNGPLQELKRKFERLKELQIELGSFKEKYAEHDALLSELLPLFIEQDVDKFIVNREITLGRKRYRFSPHFYNEQKNQIMPKVWKSTAFTTGTIE